MYKFGTAASNVRLDNYSLQYTRLARVKPEAHFVVVIVYLLHILSKLDCTVRRDQAYFPARIGMRISSAFAGGLTRAYC